MEALRPNQQAIPSDPGTYNLTVCIGMGGAVGNQSVCHENNDSDDLNMLHYARNMRWTSQALLVATTDSSVTGEVHGQR